MTFLPHQQTWSCNKYHDFLYCLDKLLTSFKLNNESIALWTNSTSSYSFIRTVRVALLQRYVNATFSKVFRTACHKFGDRKVPTFKRAVPWNLPADGQ